MRRGMLFVLLVPLSGGTCTTSAVSFEALYTEAVCQRTTECLVEAGLDPITCVPAEDAPPRDPLNCDYDADEAAVCLQELPTAPCGPLGTIELPGACTRVRTNCL